MNISIQALSKSLSTQAIVHDENNRVKQIYIDTRTIQDGKDGLFLAMAGAVTDGHQHIEQAYQKGVRNFLISDASYVTFADCNYLISTDVVATLQQIAAQYRRTFNLPILAITGSNGKTTIKEWLYQMLYDRYTIVKSPKSYNSQIGVPLSLINIESYHNLGIFEAGISTVGEMEKHRDMLRPQVGIFTNIGDAHDSGFSSRHQKIAEKSILFQDVETLIYCKDHVDITEHLKDAYPEKEHLTWSLHDESADVYLSRVKQTDEGSTITVQYDGNRTDIDFHYSESSAIENILHCICYMLHLGLSMAEIARRVRRVSGLHMRLEMKKGNHDSIIINDAYSSDISALKIALDFLDQQAAGREKVLILSALEQSGKSEQEIIQEIKELASAHHVEHIHYIGTVDGQKGVTTYGSKKELLENLHLINTEKRAFLVKGARRDRLEEVVHLLATKGHSTKLTINLSALEHNIRQYKELLNPETNIIAVIKAGAYGSGSAEVAKTLAYSGVSHLAVAYVDEGIALRNQGVGLPIIVLNSGRMDLSDIIRYDLQPEVYSLTQLKSIIDYTEAYNVSYRIHVMLDTGMRRLGFVASDMEELIPLLKNKNIEIASIFSHLVSSEDKGDDAFTEQQFSAFDQLYDRLSSALQIRPARHILNSAGITRFAERQYDMVRLGLGLYGIDGAETISDHLQKVHSLTSTILQIKKVPAGESIGYNRRTILDRDSRIGIVNIGYADGLMRNLGNKKYTVSIRGQQAEILGTVSMDLIVVDLTDINGVNIGESVVIFDQNHPIEYLAKAAETIPYEILSRISERVDRLYIRQ